MKLGSTVRLPEASGSHFGLDLKACPEDSFRVTTAGVGGVYYDLVECIRCRREFKAYGEQIQDGLKDRCEQSTSSFRVRLSYEYAHRNAVAAADAPEMDFEDYSKAVDVFTGITAAACAFLWDVCGVPGHSADDILNSATVELETKGTSGWRRIERRELMKSSFASAE